MLSQKSQNRWAGLLKAPRVAPNTVPLWGCLSAKTPCNITHQLLVNCLILQLARPRIGILFWLTLIQKYGKNRWQKRLRAALLGSQNSVTQWKQSLVISLCFLSCHQKCHLAKRSLTATLCVQCTPISLRATGFAWQLTPTKIFLTSCQHTLDAKIYLNSIISDYHKSEHAFTVDIKDFLCSTMSIFQYMHVHKRYIPLQVSH